VEILELFLKRKFEEIAFFWKFSKSYHNQKVGKEKYFN
jgi:hypothetical protein